MISDTKTKLTTTLDKELMAWIDENIESKRFATKAHAIEYALAMLKSKSDGSAPLGAPYELNEKGEPCYPMITRAKDVVAQMIPQYAPVEKPAELSGWNLIETPPLRGGGIEFPYIYRRIVDKIALEIMTDPSQEILRIEVIPIGPDDRLQEEPVEWGEYDVRKREWRSSTAVGVERGIYQLDHFAAALVRLAERLNTIGKPKTEAAEGAISD